MTAADVDPDALRAFSGDLALYATKQADAMADVARELEAVEAHVEAHVRQCIERERACLWALYNCQGSDPPVDCSGEAAALEEARSALQIAERGLAEVKAAGYRWSSAQQAHAQLLATTVPQLRVGLDRRVTSLDQYNSWSVSILASADLLLGGRWPLRAPERPEFGRGGPEVR